jgi:hypothetical protein
MVSAAKRDPDRTAIRSAAPENAGRAVRKVLCFINSSSEKWLNG